VDKMLGRVDLQTDAVAVTALWVPSAGGSSVFLCAINPAVYDTNQHARQLFSELTQVLAMAREQGPPFAQPSAQTASPDLPCLVCETPAGEDIRFRVGQGGVDALPLGPTGRPAGCCKIERTTFLQSSPAQSVARR
jgi:hypothetical protein